MLKLTTQYFVETGYDHKIGFSDRQRNELGKFLRLFRSLGWRVLPDRGCWKGYCNGKVMSEGLYKLLEEIE